MKKKIGDKVVNIDDNIANMVSKAEECRAMKSKLTFSTLNVKHLSNYEMAVNIAIEYNNIRKNLKYPFNLLETNIMYEIIGMLLNERLKVKYYTEDGSLVVYLKKMSNPPVVIKLKGSDFSINLGDQVEYEIGLEKYSLDEEERKIYDWCYDELRKGKDTSNFYSEFLPELSKEIKDTKSIELIMKGLYKNKIPNNYRDMAVKTNTILDYKNGKEYQIDFYYSGKKVIKNKFVQVKTDKGIVEKPYEEFLVDFDVFCKVKTPQLIGKYKLVENQPEYIDKLIEMLLEFSNKELEKIEYRAVYLNKMLIVEYKGATSNTLYIVNMKDKQQDVIFLGNRTKIIKVLDNRVFYEVTDHISKDVEKITLRAYNTEKNAIEVYNLDYVN